MKLKLKDQWLYMVTQNFKENRISTFEIQGEANTLEHRVDVFGFWYTDERDNVKSWRIFTINLN